MADKDDKERMTIRGLDPQLYKLARIEALREGVTIAEWLNNAMRDSLQKKGAIENK